MISQLIGAAAIALLGVLVVVLGGRVVNAVFRLADRATGKDQPAVDEGPPQVQAAASQLRGGAWIGMLERLAVYIAIVAGYPEGMALAVAVKGLARYPELKASHTGAAERFIIGTFVSVLLAVTAAGAALLVVRLL